MKRLTDNSGDYPYNLVSDVLKTIKCNTDNIAELNARVEYCIADCTVTEKKYLMLYYRDHISYKEIAKKLEVTIVSVASSIKKALSKISTYFNI